jgi:hypothetical protein
VSVCSRSIRSGLAFRLSLRHWRRSHSPPSLPDFARISGWLKKQWADSLVLTGIAFLTGAISEVSYWLLDTFPMLGKIG